MWETELGLFNKNRIVMNFEFFLLFEFFVLFSQEML